AYFDETGLYAFGNQPRAMFRNLVRLAEALRPLVPDLAIGDVYGDFEALLDKAIETKLLRRLGLESNGAIDAELVGTVFGFLNASEICYERFFFDLHGGLAREEKLLAGDTKHHYTGEAWKALRALLELYAPAQSWPTYYDGAAPCTLLIDEIEAIWSAIDHSNDWSPFTEKIRLIRAKGEAR
ncbi:MAG: protein adenylyltransferase SelO family protein, partial [Polyangiaceae bacterium]